MLSDKQRDAIDRIAAGQSFTRIEQEIDISHTQLWRWRHDNEEFKAELQQRRALVHEARCDRLWALGDRALGVAEELLDEGDPKMAIDVLKLIGPGLTDVRYITERPPADQMDEQRDVLEHETSAFVCQTCGKVCRAAGALARHVQTHSS